LPSTAGAAQHYDRDDLPLECCRKSTTSVKAARDRPVKSCPSICWLALQLQGQRAIKRGIFIP